MFVTLLIAGPEAGCLHHDLYRKLFYKLGNSDPALADSESATDWEQPEHGTCVETDH